MKEVLTSVITLIAAALFASGYAYLDAFYDFFGISLREINPGLQEVLVFSTTSLGSIFYMAIVPGAFILIISALYDKEARSQRTFPAWTFSSISIRTGLLALILFSLVLFPHVIKTSRIIALENAKEHLKNSFQNSLRVEKGRTPYPLSDMISRGVLKSGSYREHHFLFATEATIFAITKIAQPDHLPANTGAPGLGRVGYDMIRIPRGSDVVFSVHRQDDPLKTMIGE